jgi:hypothetical protein
MVPYIQYCSTSMFYSATLTKSLNTIHNMEKQPIKGDKYIFFALFPPKNNDPVSSVSN